MLKLMPPNAANARRLDDLLLGVRETLDIELKGWIDIVGDADHKAVLAKALIALANHGGGYVVLGYQQADEGSQPAPNRPASLANYNPDTVNAIVAAYAEPVFHCDVVIATGPDGNTYPIIAVPGGHAVPIRSKRAGPEGRTVRINSYYIRRLGPQSEVPQSGQEWDTLIRRCIANAREDILDQLRTIMAGGAAQPLERDDRDQLQLWHDAALARWRTVVEELPADHAARFPRGHFSATYQLSGAFERPALADLRGIVDRATVRHTGWPPFWVPTRQEIAPYVFDDALECWIGSDARRDDPAHSDFWRISPDGRAFLIRGYQEDTPNERGIEPGTGFDLTIPTWRVGEVLLHAASLARQFGDPQAQISLRFEWTGLAGRQLVAIGNPNRLLFGGQRARQDSYSTTVSVQADQVADTLPEIVDRVVRPLYELFDFFRLPGNLTAEELAAMRRNQF